MLRTNLISSEDFSAHWCIILDDYPRTGASTSDNNYSVEYTQLLEQYNSLLEKVTNLLIYLALLTVSGVLCMI